MPLVSREEPPGGGENAFLFEIESNGINMSRNCLPRDRVRSQGCIEWNMPHLSNYVAWWNQSLNERDNGKANARWGGQFVITTEIALHCLLRYLAGGSYIDIRLSAGISIPSFFRIVHDCIRAILRCDDLSFSFPSTDEELQKIADGFRALSTQEVVDGCVGCVDGLLLKVRTPSSKEAGGNVKAYFSGHYQTYGINIQAACDSKCRFISVCVAAPGGCNDIAAFRKSPLHELVQTLPMGKYIIGDNAYCCSEHLLTPFSGKYDPNDYNQLPSKILY